MMHGHQKSDLVIVAMQSEESPPRRRLRGRSQGVGGAKGGGQGEYAPAKHALDSEPGSRVKGAGAYTATVPSHTRGGSRMRESRTYGSGRGACDETDVPTATPWLAALRRVQRHSGNTPSALASRRFSYCTISTGTVRTMNVAARPRRTATGDARFANASPKE
jgi:hypothetical protein